MQLVLDVSNNDPIDLKTFKASGAVALIAKATEGVSFQDKTLPVHRMVARETGKPFGSYLFLHPNSRDSEADYYLRYARPQLGDIQPVVDAEVADQGIAYLARRSYACLHRLEMEGYKPLLYASAGIWKQLVADEPRLKRFRVWEAQYPGRFTRWFPSLAQKRIKLLHGVSVVLWQWTDSYTVDGHRYDASALLAPLDTITIGGNV